MVNTSNITDVCSFRACLHTYGYSNEELLGKLINCLSNSLDVINYELDMVNRTLKFKIRKSSYKKKSNFVHSATYYYPLVSGAFRNFLESIRGHLVGNGICTDEALNNVLNSNIDLLYDLTCVGDNTVIIRL